MEALTRFLREIVEVELPRARRIAGDETWKGPRADVVAGDLERLHRLLASTLDRTEQAFAATEGQRGTDEIFGVVRSESALPRLRNAPWDS